MRGYSRVQTSLLVALTVVATGVSAAAAPATLIEGTDGDDVLIGTPEREVMYGLGGADVLQARGGPDHLSGGPGDDQLWGGAGRDLMRGDAGDDVLRGGVGPDLLDDGERGETVGTDRLYGGYGPDFLGSSEGPDQLYGGGQNDKLFFVSPNVVANGGPGDDWLWAFYDEESSADGSTLVGGAGADLLQTHVSSTELRGGRGNDTLNAFVVSGARLVGGPGDDYLESTNSTLGVNDIVCGPGHDTVFVSSDDNVAADC